MGALRTALRCNRCGGRIGGPNVVICPHCQADLSQDGVWSELLEWGKDRQMGRTMYIWRRVMPFWGLIAVIVAFGQFLSRGEWNAVAFSLTFLVFLTSGYLYGRWFWRSAEQQYLTAARDGFNPRAHFRRPAHW